MASLPNEHVIQVSAELGAVTARPGDKLVVATPSRLSAEKADELKVTIASRLPGIEVVIVTECSGLVVYRDGDST